jgi:hypothetical protein
METGKRPRMETKMQNAIHLMGMGLMPAKPAAELKVGDVLSWNYTPKCSEVVAIEPWGKQGLKIHEKCFSNGKVYIRLVRKTKLIAA